MEEKKQSYRKEGFGRLSSLSFLESSFFILLMIFALAIPFTSMKAEAGKTAKKIVYSPKCKHGHKHKKQGHHGKHSKPWKNQKHTGKKHGHEGKGYSKHGKHNSRGKEHARRGKNNSHGKNNSRGKYNSRSVALTSGSASVTGTLGVGANTVPGGSYNPYVKSTRSATVAPDGKQAMVLDDIDVSLTSSRIMLITEASSLLNNILDSEDHSEYNSRIEQWRKFIKQVADVEFLRALSRSEAFRVMQQNLRSNLN